MPFGDHCPHGRDYATCVPCGRADDAKSVFDERPKPKPKKQKITQAELHRAQSKGVQHALKYARQIVGVYVKDDALKRKLQRQLQERQFYFPPERRS